MPAPFEPSSRVNIACPRHEPHAGTVTNCRLIDADIPLWRIMVTTNDGCGPWLLHVHEDGTTASGRTIEAAS